MAPNEVVAMRPIEIYTTPTCPHCKAAKMLLGEFGITFTEIDVDQNAAAADTMVARSGRNTLPQLFISAGRLAATLHKN